MLYLISLHPDFVIFSQGHKNENSNDKIFKASLKHYLGGFGFEDRQKIVNYYKF